MLCHLHQMRDRSVHINDTVTRRNKMKIDLLSSRSNKNQVDDTHTHRATQAWHTRHEAHTTRMHTSH